MSFAFIGEGEESKWSQALPFATLLPSPTLVVQDAASCSPLLLWSVVAFVLVFGKRSRLLDVLYVGGLDEPISSVAILLLSGVKITLLIMSLSIVNTEQGTRQHKTDEL